MTGPTTTGSIDAKLTVDDSDFKRGMAEAKAEAKEVGALEPTVKVDANVGPALAKLEAVAAAERNLDLAYQRSAISQEELSKVTEKYGEDSTQAASARLAHSRATGAETAAEEKLTRAKQIGTVEEDKSTEATNRGNAANNRRVSGLQVLLGLAPGILAAAAPIAAAAVGLGVAFGVMGVSGILAIKGIKDAMAVGDSVGNQYAAGLGALKGNLDQLSATSANAMLGSFNGAVGDINAHMPFLNQLVREGSGLLGAMGGTALSGVLNGLERMNPLVQSGGVELGKFVTWLFSFTNSNGFTEFLSYASANLPAVMHLIESLVTTAGHVIAAFAPMGPVVIGVLTAISDGLSSLPLPMLAGLVTTATLLGPAMRIAGAGVAMFEIESTMAIPVVGILLAALSGLGIMAATAAQGTDTSSASMENYTQALRDDTNAIGEHVRAQAAKALVDSGATEAARTLGVSIADVTAAAEGNTDALNRLKAVQKDASMTEALGIANGNLTDQQSNAAKAADMLMNAVQGTNGAINDGIQKNKDYDAAIAATKAANDAATPAVQAHAAAYGVTVQMYQNAVTAQQQTATQVAQTTTNMQLQNDAAGLLKQAWDALNGKTLSAAQAQNSFDSSLVNMGDHVSATGKKITFTTDSISDMSAASVALRGQLNGQVSNLERVIEANGGLQNATAQSKQQYADMREQIINNAVAHGVDKDAVTAYIDKIFQVPKATKTTLELDTAAAEAALAALTRHRTVEITAITNEVRGGGSADDPSMTALNPEHHADGGMAGVSYLAGGGFPGAPRGTDTVPTWLTPGEVVMKRASVQSLGSGNLLEANRTGKWPGQGQSNTAQLPPIYVQNPFTGEYLLAKVSTVVDSAIDGVSRQLGGMRR